MQRGVRERRLQAAPIALVFGVVLGCFRVVVGFFRFTWFVLKSEVPVSVFLFSVRHFLSLFSSCSCVLVLPLVLVLVTVCSLSFPFNSPVIVHSSKTLY